MALQYSQLISDVRRDSLDPTTVDFCESVDIRDRAGAVTDAVVDPFVAVDSPLSGEEVDVREAAILSALLEKDLLLRGRWACAWDNPSMWAYTVAGSAIGDD